MKRILTFSLSLALSSAIYADSLQTLTFGMGMPGRDEPELEGMCISPDGKYVSGTVAYGYGVFVADRETNEVRFEMITTDNEDAQTRGVNNHGVAAGLGVGGILFSFADDEVTPLVPPENYRGVTGQGVTEDGMIIASLSKKSYETDAAYSFDGENWTLLPVPDASEYVKLFKTTPGSMAKHVSQDGSVIFGCVGNFGAPIVWTRNADGEYEYDFFTLRFVKTKEEDINDPSKPLYALSALYQSLSPDGRYCAMAGITKPQSEGSGFVPVIYDTVTKNIIIYDEPQDIDESHVGLVPTAICNNGSFIGTIDITFASLGTFVWKAGETKAQLLNEAFSSYEKYAESDKLGFTMPVAMSEDGKYIVGYTFESENFYDDSPAYYVTFIIDTGDYFSNLNDIKGISADNTDAVPVSYYSIDGRRQMGLTNGLNIVRMSDGSTRKIMK